MAPLLEMTRKWKGQGQNNAATLFSGTVCRMERSVMLKYTAALLNYMARNFYIHKHSQADISHSICPECAKEHYPDLDIHD